MEKRAKRIYGNTKVAYLFMSPFLVLFCLFTIIPVAVALGLSLTNYNMMETPAFVGINHFKNLILDDEVFLIALKNTFIFSLISGPISFFASFIFAWLINSVGKLRNFFALAFYAPSITSSVAMSVVWLYFFSSDSYGLVNSALSRLGIISEPVKWTMDPKYLLGVVIFISVWMGMGAGFLSFLAGLQNLSPELSEAGMIDGVKNAFQELIYIILPQLKPQMLFGAINAIVGSFAVFDITVSVAGIPSPEYAAHTIVAHLYDYAFIRFEMGYASAVAIMLFAITFILGRVVMKLFSNHDQ